MNALTVRESNPVDSSIEKPAIENHRPDVDGSLVNESRASIQKLGV